MKLTGEQLYEWWREEASGSSWERLSVLEQVPWDALADKLNEMMAGKRCFVSKVFIVDDPLQGPGDSLIEVRCELPANHEGVHRCHYGQWSSPDDVARHHATCPYRHGTGDCSC